MNQRRPGLEALDDCASSTSLTTCASAVSFTVHVTTMSNAPRPLNRPAQDDIANLLEDRDGLTRKGTLIDA